jgi:hypothetical protein
MPFINEVVRAGNSTARVKNYYANGTIVLYDIVGEFRSGQAISCDDSGEIIVLQNFTVDLIYDLEHDDRFDYENANLVVTDTGSYIATDAHFNGKPSQEYQSTYLVIE